MKKENSTLTSKLKTYSAVAGTVLAAGQAADAQVIYTDLDPDVDIAVNTIYDLDLNNDGVADYGVAFYTAGTTGGEPRTAMFLICAPGNKVAASTGYQGAYVYPSVLNLGDEIGPGLNFYSTRQATYSTLLTMGTHFFFFGGTYGNWFGNTDKYLGLYFDDNGGMKYGWARLDCGEVGTPSITVKDYAYKDVDDTPINAGEATGITTPATTNDGLSIFAFEKDVYISASNLNDSKLFITVTNMMGQAVRAVGTEHTSLRLGLGDVADGVYLVTVQNGSESMTRKVSIK